MGMDFSAILDEARDHASQGNFRGDYLTSDQKDEMVRNRDAFWIFDVDKRANKFEVDKEQWVVTIGYSAERTDEDYLLTLSGNPWRDRFFQHLIQALATVPEGSAIGPCVLTKIKTKTGARAFDIEKWMPSIAAAPSPAPRIQPTAIEETSEQDKPRRGRPSKVEQARKEAQEKAAAQQAAPASESVATVAPAPAPAPAPNPTQPTGSGVFRAANTVTATCPDCGQDETGVPMKNGEGEDVILHNCEAVNGRPVVLKVA